VSLLLLGPCALGAQSVQTGQSLEKNPLAHVKSMRCTFSSSSTGTWENDVPKAVAKAEETSIEIDSINTDEGTARIVGSGSDITAVLSPNSLHFMERSFLGNVTITTVFSRESPKGKFRAVRSRHDYLPIAIPGAVSEPTVSQSYGSCEAI